MTYHRSKLSLAFLFTLYVCGTAVAVYGLWMALFPVEQLDYVTLFQLAAITLAISPLFVLLPSGIMWRPGTLFLMISMFLLPPGLAAIVGIPGFVVMSIRSKSRLQAFTRFLSRQAVALFMGAYTYHLFIPVLNHIMFGKLISLLFALGVHHFLFVVSSAHVLASTNNTLVRTELRKILKELHWGYVTSYLVIALGAYGYSTDHPGVLVVTAIILVAMSKSFSYYMEAQKIQQTAWIDGLTGIENRASWDKFVDENKALRGTIVVIDIDRFKYINEQLGHSVGDVVIQNVVSELRKHMPRHTRMFRFGGDEIICYVPKILHCEPSELMSETIEILKAPNWGIWNSPVSLSVGMATTDVNGSDPTILFKIADARMFSEKQKKRGSSLDIGTSSLIHGLMASIELKDKYTAGHNLRVAFYAVRLAEQLELDSQQVKSIFRASVVHDIGKIAIPDVVLNKPDKLNDTERAIIEEHPKIGYEMCGKLGFTSEELEIILLHHEHWDGTGYPNKLTDDQIPRLVRIVTLVDVYDALTSERSYRAAWAHEKTMEYLKVNAGKLFDPDLVQIWERLNDPSPLKHGFNNWVRHIDPDRII